MHFYILVSNYFARMGKPVENMFSYQLHHSQECSRLCHWKYFSEYQQQIIPYGTKRVQIKGGERDKHRNPEWVGLLD